MRPLRPDDVAFLLDLWVEAWAATMPDIDFAARRDWLAAFLADPAHATLVADGPDGPRGFVTLECGHMHQLVVRVNARGDGTAIRLLDAAKAASPAGLSLDVNQANTRAVRFYTREGFAITGAGRNDTSGLATWRMLWRP